MARLLKFKEIETSPCNSKGTAEHSTQPTADFFSVQTQQSQWRD